MSARATHRLRELVRLIAGREIAVVGDLMLDRYVWGQVSRISPEAPVPIVEVGSETTRPGGAANVAANLAALGARPQLFGAWGEDAAAELLSADLAGHGIPVEGIEAVPGRTTTVKTRVVAHGTQIVRVDRESRGALSAAHARRLQERLAEAAARTGVVIVSDYGKGVVDAPLMRVLTGRGSREIWVAVDPKDPTMELYRGATLLTPNLAEAGGAFGRPLTSEPLVMEAGTDLLRRLDLRALLITRGDQGMSLFERDGGFTHFPTTALEVYDVTGAGDTVIAALMAVVAAGGTLAEAAMLANQAAGIAVREVGTAAVTADELLLSLEE